jgi:hypothetical protein
MSLPIDFRFSQNNLQDYVDCPRRFELKYLLKQDWPALVSEPIQEFERLQFLGLRFHTLVQQHLAGIPVEKLETALDDPNLKRWWTNYLVYIDQYLNSLKTVEYPQIINFHHYRLIAKYDLLIFEQSGNTIILDWKTTQYRTSPSILRTKLQSLVYPFVLAEANKEICSPENIRMIFWFPEFPDEPEVLDYSSALHRQTEKDLIELIDDIGERKNGKFELTDDKRKCRYCIYRSLCDRGIQAGDFTKNEEEMVSGSEAAKGINFNEIEEIEF